MKPQPRSDKPGIQVNKGPRAPFCRVPWRAPVPVLPEEALKHTTPSAPAPSASDTTPYQHIVRDVLAQARPLMERVAEATRMSLLTRQDQARTPGEHNAMHEARQQLSRLTSVMGERYPDALRKALDQEAAQNQEKPTRSLFTVHFDDLELMDEAQINDSVERVESGTALVDKAGTTMNEVVDSVRRVTDIMGEISSASKEQSDGVAQIGEAVTQMDQATQQNAALVEEMAAAASSLRGQATDLVQAVAVFRLSGNPMGFSAVTPVVRTPVQAPMRTIAAPVLKRPAARAALPAAKPATKTPAVSREPAHADGGADWESF